MSRRAAETLGVLDTEAVERVEQAVAAIRDGALVVVADTIDDGSEGSLVVAAERCTAEAVNFMTLHGKGLVFVCLTEQRCDDLGLRMLAARSGSRTGVSVAIEARAGVSTGFSTRDRAHTIRVAADPSTGPDDIVQEGHVFPLPTRAGGVLERAVHAEASVDLARLAGLSSAAAICEIMLEDGTMARLPELLDYCTQHGLALVTVSDLIDYRLRTERLVERVHTGRVATRWGELGIEVFEERLNRKQHIALVKGDVAGEENVLVRVHSECLLGDVFGSTHCDCASQLERALETIEAEGAGVLLYMTQDGRGLGVLDLLSDVRRHDVPEREKTEEGVANTLADVREYGIGCQILTSLGLSTIRVLTDNPKPLDEIERFGLQLVEQVSISSASPPGVRRPLHHQDMRLG